MVPNPPTVKITDANGNSVPNVAVTFAVASGGGSVTGASQTTNESGIATVGSWRLGTIAGTNTLIATVNGASAIAGMRGVSASAGTADLVITFTATATAGAPGSITLNAGDAQTAVAGTAVTIAPSVKVLDASNNPVSGASVNFFVENGGGTLTGASATTNASGIATVGSWILGPSAGTNTITAAAVGLVGSVTFTATGITGPAALITIDSGNNQSAIAGTAVAIAPSVKVTDVNNNVVSGAAVTFAVASGGGSITGASATSSASGIATVGSWTLGASVGVNTLAASLNGVTGATVTFTATGSPPPPLDISVSGRLERSSTISVAITQNGSVVSPSAYTMTLVPADGGQVNGDGTVKLLKTGQLTINATSGNASGTSNITVAQPPLVVFDLVRNFSRQIWQVAIDGGDLQQLTNVGSDNQHGSRVGTKLVYAGARGGRTFDLFSLNTATSVETQLTNTTYAERDPNLSPNGNKLVYVSAASGLDRAMYSNADGTGIGFVADNSSNTGAIEISPAWSPGSDKVLFSSTADGGTPDLWLQQTPGTVALKLPAPANSTSAELNGVWNTSNQIAFHTTRSGSDEIWLTTTAGTTASRLTSGAAPTWLPDGRIVFVRFTGATGSLYWIDPANPAVVQPINVGGGDAQRPSAVLP
jgi:Tol biopolymer transport system component